MKILSILAAAALLGLAAPAAQAQVNININPPANVAVAPSWGPALPAGAQYYYLPTVGGFYDVPARQYVVSRNGKWVRTATLVGYSASNLQPVVVDYVGAQPWVRYDTYRTKYGKGHPHGMPPGQAKKMYGKGYNGGYRRDDDDRRDDRYDDRDDRGRGKHEDQYEDKYKGKHADKHEGKGKGHGKH